MLVATILSLLIFLICKHVAMYLHTGVTLACNSLPLAMHVLYVATYLCLCITCVIIIISRCYVTVRGRIQETILYAKDI